ncbi:acyl-CoA reductase [Methanofollis fontis]|uniref:acyl-CoA reductase n=1 Tax=Methanofollis fontis TaxID=2052832 RepID=UPI0013EEB92E|nr:acyl-CoA reductase [Methanofollis fontis]
MDDAVRHLLSMGELKIQSYGDAVTPMKNDNITWLVGDKIPEYRVFEPYSDVVCSFLSDLSQTLLKDKSATQYPDIASFAYFCRKANILKKKESFVDRKIRLGRGIIFHISPSNVPINFAFSYVFGLLAGNGNIVRVPSKTSPQTDIVCNAVKILITDEKYGDIHASTAFVKYGHEDEITAYFSSIAQGRIIWGGDGTIAYIRKFALPSRGVDIAFSDRYSCAVIDSDAVMDADTKEIKRLANAFYNDTYLMDQNACSSPQLIVWRGDACKEAQKKFWNAVADFASRKYDLQPVSAVDKYTKLCSEAIENKYVSAVSRYGNILYIADLTELPDTVDNFRGICGYFYQYHCDDLAEIAHIVNEKYQTLVYYGLSPPELSEFVTKNQLKGIDRIVPIGQALDIDVIWDGYDLIKTLSRIIDVR